MLLDSFNSKKLTYFLGYLSCLYILNYIYDDEKTKPSSNKTAITFLSGSAGELDWLMPILSLILNQGFKLKIIFLSNHVYLSIKKK